MSEVEEALTQAHHEEWARVVAELHRGTDLVMAWPVDTPEALGVARQVGADAVISKDLDLLKALVAER